MLDNLYPGLEQAAVSGSFPVPGVVDVDRVDTDEDRSPVDKSIDQPSVYEWVAGVASGIRGDDGPVAAATAGFFRVNGIDPDRLEDDADRADATLARVAESIAAGFAARCTAGR